MTERCATTVKEEPEIESPALVLVKEESMISNESWLDRIKEEPTSPLSVNTPREEPDEFEDHDMDMKELIRESIQCPHFECSAWSCISWIASSATQSLSGDITAMNSQKRFFKSSFSDHEILVPASLESEKPFAVVPSSTAGDTMKKEEAADVYLSKGHVVQQMAGDKQDEHSNKNECRSSPKHEETYYQRSILQSGSLRSSTRKSFKCDHCEKIVKKKQNLIDHMRVHSGDCPFQCIHCGKTFIASCNLTRHIQTHTGDRPFKCSQCGKFFIDIGSLTRHLRIHSGDRPFKCSQCGKSFTQRSHITTHMLRRNGDRFLKCSFCEKSFTQRGHLTRHMLRHTGDRPFKCSLCGKSFTESGTLTAHLRIHSGNQPFKCSQCGKSFTESGHLTRHMQKHRDRPSKHS